MVVQAEQDRVRQLLAEALPMLCKSGLSFCTEFCIEALIGITLDKNDVILVSIKETVKGDHADGDRSIEVSVSHEAEKPTSPKSKSHRKRKRPKAALHKYESDADTDLGHDAQSEIKREKRHDDDSGSEQETDNSAYSSKDRDRSTSSDAIIVKTEPAATDFSSVSFEDNGQGYDMSGYPHPLASSTMSSPQSAAGTSYGQAMHVIPNANQQGAEEQPPGAQQSARGRPPYSLATAPTTPSEVVAKRGAVKLGAGAFLCVFCQKVYRSNQAVQNHIKTGHLGELNFPCQFCNKKFSTKGNKVTHERICKDKPEGMNIDNPVPSEFELHKISSELHSMVMNLDKKAKQSRDKSASRDKSTSRDESTSRDKCASIEENEPSVLCPDGKNMPLPNNANTKPVFSNSLFTDVPNVGPSRSIYNEPTIAGRSAVIEQYHRAGSSSAIEHYHSPVFPDYPFP